MWSGYSEVESDERGIVKICSIGYLCDGNYDCVTDNILTANLQKQKKALVIEILEDCVLI